MTPAVSTTHHQIHESFLFFRYDAGADFIGTLDGTILPSLAVDLESRKIAPKSVSVLWTDGRILISIGYEADDSYAVNFSVDVIGSENAILPEFSAGLAEAAEQREVLCHSLFQVPGSKIGLVYALLMSRA